MRFLRFLGFIFATFTVLGVAGVVAGYFLVQHYSADLPDISQLEKYDPPVVTRVLAGDGRLLAEYAIEKRIFVDRQLKGCIEFGTPGCELPIERFRLPYRSRKPVENEAVCTV